MNLGPLNYKSSILTAQPPWMTFTLWGEWSEVKCKKILKKFWKNFEKILKFPGFDWLAMWHCGLFYNAYLKNLQPFTRKGQGFCFTLCTLSYLIPISGTLSGAGYSELILLFLEPAFLRHFSAHVLSLNMHSK